MYWTVGGLRWFLVTVHLLSSICESLVEIGWQAQFKSFIIH